MPGSTPNIPAGAPNIGAGFIGTAGNAASGLFGAIGNMIANKKNRKWNEKMYERQYQDNIAFWNMQNAYNSPEAQVARMKAAGLNPALMYGQGNTGNAGSIQSPDAPRMQYDAPDFSGFQTAGMNFLSALYDFDLKEAAIDKTRAETTAIAEKGALDAISGDFKKWELGFKERMEDTQADYLKEQLRKLKQDIEISMSKEVRAIIQSDMDLELKSVKISREYVRSELDWLDIDQKKAVIEGIKHSNVIKELDAWYAERKIRPQDPFYAHMLVQAIEKIIPVIINKFTPKSLEDKLKGLDNKGGFKSKNIPGVKFDN